MRSYEGADVVDEFRPNTKLAVTIPTVDPHRGRLFGIAVQLPTLVRDETGNEFPCAARGVVGADGLALAGPVTGGHAFALRRGSWRRAVSKRLAA